MPSMGSFAFAITLITQLAAGATSAPADDLAAHLARPLPGPALALAQAGDPAAPQITEALQADSNAAPLMAWALEQHPVAAARPALEQAVHSTDQRLGYWAAKALGSLGDLASLPALEAELPQPDGPQTYWELARRTGLGWVSMFERRYENGQVVIPPAPEGVPNIRVAYAALLAMGEIGGPDAVASLTRMLDSDQWLIRLGAVKGLGSAGDTGSLERLRAMHRGDAALVVRTAAREAIEAITGSASGPPERGPLEIPAIAFVKSTARSESSLGFQDSYPFPLTPWYQWGENVYTLTPPTPDGELRCITELQNARVQGLEVSYDGTKLLFSVSYPGEGEGFHVCEIGVDGSGFRQITHGNCNDVDPQYLPDGRIVFVSDRSGHQEYYHQERSRNLYVMEADGSNL
ncbi:MAG: hypothetical protein GF320_01735, partial [Armatimonadia bacterium]|nr:hypothetical protein [Armatimonadia bacterium]